MTLPIPPNDSFYKFTAISGLIIVVLSLYIPWQMLSEIRIATFDMQLEIEKLDIEIQHWQLQVQRHKNLSQLTEEDLTALEKDIQAKKHPSKSAMQRVLT